MRFARFASESICAVAMLFCAVVLLVVSAQCVFYGIRDPAVVPDSLALPHRILGTLIFGSVGLFMLGATFFQARVAIRVLKERNSILR